MDTHLPTLSTEDFDALISQHDQMSAAQQSSVAFELPNNLRQALAWSLELAPQVMTNLLSRSLQSMDRKTVSLEGTSQAQLLEEAAAAMEEQRARWLRQFPALLRVAMAHPAPTQLITVMPSIDLRICEAETAALDAAVQASGCPTNPLSPSSYVQALLELIARSDVPQDLKQIWADHLLTALSSQLAWVYLQLHAVLRDPSQREPSSMALAENFSEYAAQAYGMAGGSVALTTDGEAVGMVDTQTQAIAQQARQTVLQLRQHLGLAVVQNGDLARALSGDSMQALLHDLDEAEHLMALIHERGLPMPDLDAGIYGSSKRPEPSSPSSVAKASSFQTIETQIDELIKTYQNTTSPSLQRVPVPLREALENLKPSLRILIQEDEPVLSDDTHPARQFFDLICQRSLRYSSEAAEGFSDFMTPVDKLIGAIAQMQFVNARVFEKASAKLSTYLQQQDTKEAKKQAQAAQQQEQMQTARQLAGRIGFGLVGRKDASDAPPVVKQFLMGPWALVLARAQLLDQQSTDHERYTQAVAALLWSVSTSRVASRKTEHMALVAQLMPLLQAGLQSTDISAQQTQSFLADISQLQEAVQSSTVSAALQSVNTEPVPHL